MHYGRKDTSPDRRHIIFCSRISHDSCCRCLSFSPVELLLGLLESQVQSELTLPVHVVVT